MSSDQRLGAVRDPLEEVNSGCRRSERHCRCRQWTKQVSEKREEVDDGDGSGFPTVAVEDDGDDLGFPVVAAEALGFRWY
ncbi:hypothetical protein ACOSQ2_029071 [Xanthoceras sorbifolium]